MASMLCPVARAGARASPAAARSASMKQKHATSTWRRRVHERRSVSVAASEDDRASPSTSSEGASKDTNSDGTRVISRRGAFLNAAYLAVSLPLWRDVLHDLGYLHGAEDAPADVPLAPPGSGLRTATFAGGCFWCMEKPFDVLPGVLATTSGYAGPRESKPNPTYHEVGAGGTGYREAVQILFDPQIVSYETLLDVYWHQIDPSFPDRMFLRLRRAVFVCDLSQRRGAVRGSDEKSDERRERERLPERSRDEDRKNGLCVFPG
jgi:peptide-methionine (S)-S-oxide reductase